MRYRRWLKNFKRDSYFYIPVAINPKTMIKIKTFICLILVCHSANSYSQKTEFKEIINKYSDSVANKDYGIMALIKHDGKIHKEAIGWAADSVKMTPEKVFNIGSTTKLFTAVLIMQEIEKETINLNDSIGLFFPKNENVDPGITIEELLRHRSGLGEIVVDSIFNEAASNYFSEYNSSMIYDKIPPPQFARNEDSKYTNTNYLLLGYILEIINNLPYSEILHNRIFDPLNMDDSYAYYSSNIENAAHPMLKGKDIGKYLNFKFYKNFGFAAGAISSTLDDLEHFFTALYESDSLVSRSTFEQMIDFENYGYGIDIIPAESDNGSYSLYGHGGDNISFTSKNYYNPKTKDLIILASNHFRDPFTAKISDDLLEALENMNKD